MSLSDCEKCWDTPCTCGWEYREYSIKGLEDQIEMFKKIIEYRKLHPTVYIKPGSSEAQDFMNYMTTK